MPDPKPATESKPTAAAPVAAPKASLLPAAEASNPEVHRLLAELETARINGDQDGAKRLTEQVASLGYAAG